MILGNVPIKVGGDSKRNASLKQGKQVRNPAASIITLRNSVYILTNLYLLTRVNKEGGNREGQTATQKKDLKLKTTA